MKVLKKELLNTLIYVPFENKNIIGKFIDPRLFPYMAKKYPDLFEDEVEVKKNSKKNDISIDDTKFFGDDNNYSE